MSETNGVQANGSHAPNWEPLLAQPSYTKTRRMRVGCVGAGFSGLILAHKIQHELKLEDEIDLVIYDRNSDVGGTWFEHTYPGAACDIPSHAYILPFEPNLDWTKFYVEQHEILDYIKRTAKKWDLYKYIQLNSEIKETIWDEESGKWMIKYEQLGQSKADEVDFLINAAGFLNKWKWPAIEGLHDFEGKLLHSARWDNSYQWEDKRVAVIGNGSSGLQLVPTMQPKVSKLVNFVRQPTWIAPNFIGEMAPQNKNYAFSEEQKQIWRDDPKAFYNYRRTLEKAVNAFFFVMCTDHPLQQIYESACKARMHASMAADPALEQRTVPTTFRAGCRRITPGDGYLEALQQPNCHDEWSPITRVTPKGILTADGTEHEFDLIVCATGYDGRWLPQWKLVGRGGATLENLWAEDPMAFLTTQVEGMPNYGMVNGPNIPISHGSVLMQMNWVIEYLVKWVSRMARHDIKSIAVKKEALDDYNEYAQEFLKTTTWGDECHAEIYKNGKSSGRVTGVYPGSMMHFKGALDAVGGEHFDVEWRSKNRFRCLGNGRAESDKNGAGNLAPYMDEYPEETGQ